MEFKIEFDADAVMRKLEGALNRARDLETTMPSEFSTWQEADMGRRQAKTDTPDAMTAATTIRPRGRASLLPRRRRYLLGRRPPQPILVRTTRRGTRRPILRPELLEMLHDRMRTLLRETFARWD